MKKGSAKLAFKRVGFQLGWARLIYPSGAMGVWKRTLRPNMPEKVVGRQGSEELGTNFVNDMSRYRGRTVQCEKRVAHWR